MLLPSDLNQEDTNSKLLAVGVKVVVDRGLLKPFT